MTVVTFAELHRNHNRDNMLKFYKPRINLILIDIFLASINIIVVFVFFPLTTREPFKKYAVPFLIFISTWIIISYLLGRYKKLKAKTFFYAVFRLFYAIVISFIIFGGFILIQPKSPYSQNVLVTVLTGFFVTEYVFLFLYFAYRYATQYDELPLSQETRTSTAPLPFHALNGDAVFERKKRVVDIAGENVYNFLQRNIDINQSNVNIFVETTIEELLQTPNYQYAVYVHLKKLNNIRGINRRFALINERLPDEGRIICCYRSQNSIKQKIFKEHSKLIAYLIYTAHFIVHRIAPKLFFTKRLYYDLTGGKKRILSKTEVLGRLNYCGFTIEKQAKINGLNYVIAQRVRSINSLKQRNYGALIKLNRCGKDGKFFNVYKFRTMHPYAEYLQEYVFKSSELAEGGKFRRDIRVTTIGRILRKYWLDELPMLLNLVKGDMKLIGVRPLSRHYFSLYSNELQEKRVKTKPGLLPPFYADMPKTLDEIQASEMKYLMACENNGTFMTDTKYFFLILKNILFNKARSA